MERDSLHCGRVVLKATAAALLAAPSMATGQRNGMTLEGHRRIISHSGHRHKRGSFWGLGRRGSEDEGSCDVAIAPPSFARQTAVGLSMIPPKSSSSACSTNKAVTVPTRTFSLHVPLLRPLIRQGSKEILSSLSPTAVRANSQCGLAAKVGSWGRPSLSSSHFSE